MNVVETKTRDDLPGVVRGAVSERIDQVVEMLDGANGRGPRAPRSKKEGDKIVHEVRKRLKEIRGTIRLVRGELGDRAFQRENRAFRDAGRPLSVVRDAAVLVETLDKVIKGSKGRAKKKGFAALRRALVEKQREAQGKMKQQTRVVPGIVKSMRAARERVEQWPIESEGWEAIEEGLRRVYAAGRDAMRDAEEQGETDDEAYHEWRKRAKDLRYQLELLEPVWPVMIAPLAKRAKRLTDLLGEDHDLAVLRCVADEQGKAGVKFDRELLVTLTDVRRKGLQREAFELGRELYGEKPKRFVERVGGYWEAGRGEGGTMKEERGTMSDER